MKRSMLMCLVLACTLSGTARAQAPVAAVEVGEVAIARFAPVSWLPATVFSREDARVANELAGRIVEVSEVGSRLRKGDPLARIDDAMLRLRERENLADIGRIEARLGLARVQEQRFLALRERASVSDAQIDAARAEREVLERELEQSRVVLARTRHELRRATVRAPFDGVVSERLVAVGEYLGMGQAVARLVNLEALEVRARAPVELVQGLHPGDRLALRGAGQLGEASLLSLVPVGDASARQFELRLGVDALDATVGSALELALPTAAARDAVSVPRDAVVLRRDGNYVLRVDGDGTAARVAVQVGSTQGGRVEVQGSLAPGEQVVVRGAERLQPGQPVRVAGSGAAGGDAGQVARSQP